MSLTLVSFHYTFSLFSAGTHLPFIPRPQPFFWSPWPALGCCHFFSDTNNSGPCWLLLTWTLILEGQRFYLSSFKASSFCKPAAAWLCSTEEPLFLKSAVQRIKEQQNALSSSYMVAVNREKAYTYYSSTHRGCIIALMSREMSVTDLAFHQGLVCLCKWGDNCNDIRYLLAANSYFWNVWLDRRTRHYPCPVKHEIRALIHDSFLSCLLCVRFPWNQPLPMGFCVVKSCCLLSCFS